MSEDHNEKLREYYDKHFPCQLICNWLGYKDAGPNALKFREFSFTLNGDIYIRYQSFETAIELRNTIHQKIPIKMDIGAIYNMNPKLARSYPTDYKPQQHELVFDIDISDYDDVRNCCKSSDICNKCWPFMRIGAKILRKIMNEEFGYHKLLFVFSGRRGFHCWVCDRDARRLDQDARKAIADYLTVVTGGLQMVKRVTLPPVPGLHPMIRKALEVIDEEFEDLMIVKQDFLADGHLVQNVIDLAPSDQPLLASKLTECKLVKSSAACWATIEKITNQLKHQRGRNKIHHYIEEVKLQHCYPRLDAAVTKGMNHLLKLPFCVHPKTGNVCVPIDIDEIDSFDLFAVPNIRKNLSRESLDPYIKTMKKFVDSLNED